MSKYQIYRTRTRLYGESEEVSKVNITKRNINRNFDESLFSTMVNINGIDVEAIINQGKDSINKTMLLRPDTKVNIGDIILYEESSYLVFDFETNNIYPLAKLVKCNSTYALKGEVTQDLIGYDDAGRPIYDATQGVDTQVPCIVENKVLVGDDNQPINLPDGRVQVTMSYRDHNELQVDKSFTMYGENYQIKHVDKTKSLNGVGLLVITGQRKV